MSLFRSREWWAINLNENEMYDSQCLLTVKLGDDKFQSILLGNHKGVLRLFSPNSESLENVSGYKPSHLLLEVQLGSPILQINEGFLVSGSSNRYLAILHPRLLSVYALKKKDEATNLGDQMEIELAYQHVFRHSAHSFVLGPFGGVRGRDFICVQFLDGLLSFYEQESFAFQLYLPTFILPCNFAYLDKIDSFLFLNGLLILDCYSYEALASAGSSNDKKILKSWEYNLGENILDINTLAKNGLTIVILSERNLYGLNENGNMVFTKRLESKPVGFHCYLTEGSKSLMIIIATEGGFLNFYEEVNLRWSMKVDFIPVSIQRIFISSLSGGIVLLSEDGFLQIVYIGTHPSVYLVPQLVQPEIDFQKAQSQILLLQQKIADNDLVDHLAPDVIAVNLKIDKTARVEKDARSCNIVLEINVQCLINKIQVLFIVEPPLMVKNKTKNIFDCQEETIIENSVYVNDSCVLSSLALQVVIIYVAGEGMTRFVQKNGTLPLDLVAVETTPVKETLHKITIITNKPVCGMDQLFREFASESVSSNAIGLRLSSEDIVSILAAKSSQRYRLQSDSLAAITVILQALLERLKVHFQKDLDYSVTYSSPLPLDEFLEKIILHQSLIRKRTTLEEILSKQTSQFIAIQKKVLAKLKDVAPKSSSNLHNILKETSKMIGTSINELENTESDLFSSRSCLRSLNRLMITLLELMSVKKEDLKFLKIAFNPHVQDTDDQGWLEVQNAATSFLLRTVLAKSVKDQQKPIDIFLEPVTDTSKLAKHFASVIERVTKGTCLLERNDYEGKKEAIVTIQAAYESDESLVDEATPVATKFFGPTALKLTPKSELKKVRAVGLTEVEEEEEERETCSDFDNKQERQPVESALEGEETEGKGDEDGDDGIWDVKIMEMRI